MMRYRVWVLVLAAVALTAAADEPKVDPAQIDKLIEQLDAPRFSERQAAQQKLEEAGKPALSAVEKAAESENREVSGRALEILKRHFDGDDAELKAAATESLKRLAACPRESIARAARAILSPTPPMPQPPAAQAIPPIRIGNAQLQIQVGNAGGNVSRVMGKELNGVKEIEAEENGRKVKIVDDPANGLKVEVTEKNKDGKEETKKYEAKDAAEMKAKHPEAHRLYEEYSSRVGRVRIQQLGIPGLPPGPGAPPAPAAPLIPRLNIGRLKILRPDEVEAARGQVEQTLKELDASLEALRKAAEGNAELNKSLEHLESARKKLEELKGTLE